MKLITIEKQANNDAIEMLELAIERAKSGQITAVGIAWVGADASIGGDVSDGSNQIMMWAALERTTRGFYSKNIADSEE